MAKMTLKDFKAILKKGEMDFDFWGYEGILNIMSSYYSYKSKEEKANGFSKCSEQSQEIADIFYDYLDSKDYYKM